MYFIFAIMIIGQMSFSASLTEPECSKYDYDHKLLYKLIKIEEEVKNFRKILDEMKTRETQDRAEQKQSLKNALEIFINASEEQLDELTKKSDNLLTTFKESSEQQLQDLTNQSGKLLTVLKGSMDNFTERFEKLTKRPAIGFSVKGPAETGTSGELTFSYIITNAGNSFDKTTGKFTCTVPGYYYIAAMLLKKWSHRSNSFCSIYRNADYLVMAYTYPDTSSSSYTAAVNGVFVHLDKDDTIRLKGCTALSSLNSYSSFSGFLVTPDPE